MEEIKAGRGRFATLIGTIAFAMPAIGHHSAVIFDTTTTAVFTGTVIDYDWTNPHVYVYVERLLDNSESVVWQLEADATSIMSRSGWGPKHSLLAIRSSFALTRIAFRYEIRVCLCRSSLKLASCSRRALVGALRTLAVKV